jgi:glutaredoxin
MIIRFRSAVLALAALLVVFELLFEQSSLAQQPATTSAATKTERCLALQLYSRSDSALCRQAEEYARSLSQRREGICLEIIDTVKDKEGLDRYWRLVRQFRVKNPRVPAFYACNRFQIGFKDAMTSAAAIEDLFAIHAYVRPTCPHCRDARKFLTELSKRWRGVRVVIHDMDHELGAVQEMTTLAQRHGITAPAFPVIYVCGRVVSGYRTDTTTGRQIEDLLMKASVEKTVAEPTAGRFERRPTDLRAPLLRAVVWGLAWLDNADGVGTEAEPAQQRIAATSDVPSPEPGQQDGLPSDLPPEAEEGITEETYVVPPEPPDGVDLPWIGFVRVRDLGLPAFTLLIGLIDGFNPCAMWVLVFLLSVLVHIKDRRKIAAIAGTFVIVSGLAYFAFMAAWLNLFLLVGIARPLQIALGVLAVTIGIINVKDFFLFKRGVTLSIPESAKPGIYDRVRRIVTTDYLLVAIGLSVVLAIVVNVVELMCTAGLPALYTQILTYQQLPAWKNYAYLGLYNIGYMLDDSLMVIAFVITLSHRKLREAEGRWLKLISGIIVLALGAAMLFRPDLLQWK